MSQLLKFPHIEQYRNVIRNVKQRIHFVGKDANGENIYDGTKSLPRLEFRGSVKLHGTNAAICQDGSGTIWTQSRERILSVEADNCGFNAWSLVNNKTITELFDHIRKINWLLPKDAIISIYGEWCGQGIQSGVAISSLPKMFIVFALGFNSAQGEPLKPHWELPDNLKYPFTQQCLAKAGIYCVYSFTEWKIVIDFEQPELVQNELGDITLAVEKTCPIAYDFGIEGIGEGIVWQCVTEGWRSSNFWFKVKGEKHSVSKVKTLAAVDVEKLNSIKECADHIVSDARLEQGLQYLRDSSLEIDVKNMGAFLKWLASDAIREEADTISASGLMAKEVGKAVTDKGRRWFMDRLKTA